MSDDLRLPLHASCVTVGEAGVLITGPSGSGKSALALELMAFGATLVADDRVLLERRGHDVWAKAPDTTHGLIEARGIGILNADASTEAKITYVVDLGQNADGRIPPAREITLMGCTCPLFYAVQTPHFGASLLQMMKAGMSHR